MDVEVNQAKQRPRQPSPLFKIGTNENRTKEIDYWLGDAGWSSPETWIDDQIKSHPDNIILKQGSFDQYYSKRSKEQNLGTAQKLYHQYRGQTIAISEFH